MKDIDLTTNYLGLQLRSPLVVGAAAPLSENLDNLRLMESAGAGAVVLHSLFEEQIHREMLALHHHLEYGTNSFAEALTYFPESDYFHVGAVQYLEHIQRAKSLVKIPVIASLNSSTIGNWTSYAHQVQEAGADAIELNIYSIPTDPHLSAAVIEQEYVDILAAVKNTVDIPVAVKLSPYFTNLSYMARLLVEHGASGLVLFNRFYQPDIDIDALEVYPHVLLSTPQDLRLPMRWIAILSGAVNADFAATGGVQKGTDVIRMCMAGAKVTMIVGALLRHGINHLSVIESEMRKWLMESDYDSITELQGVMNQRNCPDPSTFERVQYLKAIQTYQGNPIGPKVSQF